MLEVLSEGLALTLSIVIFADGAAGTMMIGRRALGGCLEALPGRAWALEGALPEGLQSRFWNSCQRPTDRYDALLSPGCVLLHPISKKRRSCNQKVADLTA